MDEAVDRIHMMIESVILDAIHFSEGYGLPVAMEDPDGRDFYVSASTLLTVGKMMHQMAMDCEVYEMAFALAFNYTVLDKSLEMAYRNMVGISTEDFET